MPPKIKTKKNKKIAGELRRSQLLTTFGPGALVDFPRFSGIMLGTDFWNIGMLKEGKIRERNLELMLGKEFFFQAASPDGELADRFTLPAEIFPTWYYCPECHSLDRLNRICKSTSGNTTDYNSKVICNHCFSNGKEVKLIPSRFVVACINGHINDFDYSWWCHKNRGGSCENPKLKLEYRGTTGGLDSIVISCETCKAENTMANCMDKDALKGRKCFGTMPWLGRNEDGHWHCDCNDCNATLRVLQRSANNVYYSVNVSALTIPSWNDKLLDSINENKQKFEVLYSIKSMSEDIYNAKLKEEFDAHPELYGNDFNVFNDTIEKRFGGKNSEITEQSLRIDEYNAFCAPDTRSEDLSFVTETTQVPDDLKPFISQIKMVRKLREVMVLKGFRRIMPTADTEMQDDGENSDKFAPLSKAPLNWLPAVEMFGEGIFIKLNEDNLVKWEEKAKERYKAMGERHQDGQTWIGGGMFSAEKPRYVLLHTLAHLLIRQLTAQCGYATASIKEKIYSSYPDDSSKMCGILIYTSATDTDGSLGGLVREGEKEHITNTIYSMLEECSWCSNDPVCIESTSQGYKNLNYSACHACALLPETSCEAFNSLLDRAAVVGTPDDKELGFFAPLL